MKVNYNEPNVLSVLAMIWQLPQVLIGVLIALFGICFCKDREFIPYETEKIGVFELRMNMTDKFRFCFSVGPFVVTPYKCMDETIRHETGHSIQSLYLGPLYLVAVAIPSMIVMAYKKVFKKDAEWYHSKYPESWADKLSGLK